MKKEEENLKETARRLVSWFNAHQRDLPWREKYLPYEVWISEIMLQQTQVKTVLPYFRRWMERFPDISSVARASEEEILRYWEGLGYYSRAKNIHKTADIVVRDFAGQFPTEHRDVLKLPGIGPYTAGAIMSLAYNKDYPVVDGNVERVFARLFNIERPVREKAAHDFIWKTARELIPKGKARIFNQALMELGATVCTPRNLLCSECPIRLFCESCRLGIVKERPVPPKRKTLTPLEVAVGILVDQEKIFIQKRPPSGLMADLWEFPGGKLRDGETPEEGLIREFWEELEVKVHSLRKITVIRHNYTSFKITLHAFFCKLRPESQRPVLRAAADSRWVTPDQLNHYAFPAANRKLIQLIEQKGFCQTVWNKETLS